MLVRMRPGGPPAPVSHGNLAAVVHALSQVPDPRIDPAFARRLEARLLLGARSLAPTGRGCETPPTTENGPLAKVIRLPGRRTIPRPAAAIVAAACALAVPLLMSGAALPGSPLYPVKVALERLDLAAARDPVARGWKYLDLALDRRLPELEQIVALEGDGVAIADAARRVHRFLTWGAGLVLSGNPDAADRSRLALMASQVEARASGMVERMGSPEAAREVRSLHAAASHLRASASGQPQGALQTVAAAGLPSPSRPGVSLERAEVEALLARSALEQASTHASLSGAAISAEPSAGQVEPRPGRRALRGAGSVVQSEDGESDRPAAGDLARSATDPGEGDSDGERGGAGGGRDPDAPPETDRGPSRDGSEGEEGEQGLEVVPADPFDQTIPASQPAGGAPPPHANAGGASSEKPHPSSEKPHPSSEKPHPSSEKPHGSPGRAQGRLP